MNTEGIIPKPLAEVGPIFAKYLGMDWCENRSDVLNSINEFRELLHLHPDVPNLFTHRYYCIKPSRFCLDCQNCCSCADHYLAFTLPEDLMNVEQAWLDNEPVNIHSKWWEGHAGIKHNMSPLAAGTIIKTGKVYPVQRIQPVPSNLNFIGKSGKVYVEYYDIDGDKIKDELELVENEPVVSSSMSFGVCSVVLSGVDSPVLLLDDDGYELAHYSGRISVPQYQEFKVATHCDQRILIQGKQRFLDVCFDNEIVEIGSRNIIKEVAKFFRYGDVGTDNNETRAAILAEQRFIRLINSAVGRQRGGANQDGDRHMKRTLKLGGKKLKGGY